MRGGVGGHRCVRGVCRVCGVRREGGVGCVGAEGQRRCVDVVVVHDGTRQDQLQQAGDRIEKKMQLYFCAHNKYIRVGTHSQYKASGFNVYVNIKLQISKLFLASDLDSCLNGLLPVGNNTEFLAAHVMLFNRIRGLWAWQVSYYVCIDGSKMV